MPSARVVSIGYVGKQEPSDVELPRSIQGFRTATDLRMIALVNAKERPVDAWKNIFKQAGERYDIVSVYADPLAFMCILGAKSNSSSVCNWFWCDANKCGQLVLWGCDADEDWHASDSRLGHCAYCLSIAQYSLQLMRVTYSSYILCRMLSHVEKCHYRVR